MYATTRTRIQTLTLTGLLTALVTVSTMIIKIPIPATGGYVHPGDGLVLLSGFLLGPIYGTFAAGVGSALADLLSGYVIFAPATLVIKGVTALAGSLLYAILLHRFPERKRPALIASGLIAEAWMVFGYFLFESVLYNPATAAVGAPPNALQGIVGVILALILYPLLSSL